MRLTTRQVLVLLPLVAVACGELPTERDQDRGMEAKRGGGGPSYTLVQADLPVGFTASTARAINALHHTVGFAEGAPGRGLRGFTWNVGGGTASTVLLPEPAGTWLSEATSINDAGVIGGRVDATAVLWVPSGQGYTLVTRDTNGTIHGVRNDGVAVGMISRDWENLPAMWDASGVLTELPLPASGQFSGGVALAVNGEGDIAGKLLEHIPGGATYEWGALWVREGSGFTALSVQTGPATGVADRTGDGRIRIVTVTGESVTFTPGGAAGSWSSVFGTLPGSGLGMTAEGAIAGFISKGGFGVSFGTPYVLDQSGTLTKLPLPKSKTGAAYGVSSDLWSAGIVDRRAAAWSLVP